MRKFPKHINTRQDIENLLVLFPDKTKAYLQGCIDGRENFVPIAHYDTEAECISDETHDYVVSEGMDGVSYTQREYKVVPGNELDRLGISVEEAREYIRENE